MAPCPYGQLHAVDVEKLAATGIVPVPLGVIPQLPVAAVKPGAEGVPLAVTGCEH